VTTKNGIVVGVDGSAASIAALRWALARATEEKCPVTAVEVHAPVHALPGTSYAVQPHGTAPPVTRTLLHQTVAMAAAALPDAPEVAEVQLRGEPGVELAKAADGEAMLVLGYRPHSRVTEFLLGRVTGDCLRHARSPVVLVPLIG
jgi:nucleotide-binding universal stress UspA family protein